MTVRRLKPLRLALLSFIGLGVPHPATIWLTASPPQLPAAGTEGAVGRLLRYFLGGLGPAAGPDRRLGGGGLALRGSRVSGQCAWLIHEQNQNSRLKHGAAAPATATGGGCGG
jgi:hypothetical protein